MGGRLDAALVLEDAHFGGVGPHIAPLVLLVQSPQREVVVECDPGNTAHEPFTRVHSLVTANVNTLDSIELCIGFVTNTVGVDLWFVTVHLANKIRSLQSALLAITTERTQIKIFDPLSCLRIVMS